MKRDYTKLHWREFARQLVATGDLDPIYIMLYRARLEPQLLKRWMLAFWCFYHAGFASHVAEQPRPNFFNTCLAEYATAPRGFERRHFRGDNGIKSLLWLDQFGTPEETVNWLAGQGIKGSVTFAAVAARAEQMYWFGPWIAWKIADMLERVMKVPIDFSGADLSIYAEPRKGAALMLHGYPDAVLTDADLEYICMQVADSVNYGGLLAPPSYDRPINIQEVETIFCKYKAHVHGHYPLFNDTVETAKNLRGWGPLAERLIEYLPMVPPTVSILESE